MADVKSTNKTAAPATQLDAAGNPTGTTYSQGGTAIAPEGFTGTLVNLPQTPDNSLMYNEDGSVFTIPKDAPEQINKLKADIAGLTLAINKAEQKVTTIEAMIAEAEDPADKVVFDKNLNSTKIAIESNKTTKAGLEAQLKEFRLSLITPDQRRIERELVAATEKRDALNVRIKELEAVKKTWNITDTASESKPKEGATPATAEQAKNLSDAVAKYGSQGKAVVALVKEGWKNVDIAKFYGIPDASVPGPKNAFLKSPAGLEWLAAGGKVA